MADTFFCPRAVENGGGPDSPFRPPFNGEASWREDGTCSYCGSISPDALFKAIDAGEEIIPTDKSYKAYVGEGHRKFYFQHLSEAEKVRFVEYLNARRINIGYPGHFYIRPYFVCFPEKSEG